MQHFSHAIQIRPPVLRKIGSKPPARRFISAGSNPPCALACSPVDAAQFGDGDQQVIALWVATGLALAFFFGCTVGFDQFPLIGG